VKTKLGNKEGTANHSTLIPQSRIPNNILGDQVRQFSIEGQCFGQRGLQTLLTINLGHKEGHLPFLSSLSCPSFEDKFQVS
jgi:hypothetical protein